MATQEQVEEFVREINYWKNKCQIIEDKVEDRIRREEIEKRDAETQSEEGQCDWKDMKDCIQKISRGFTEMGSKWNSRLEKVIEDNEVEGQYDRLNNFLWGGWNHLPPISGFPFICFIVSELNRRFPSLRGGITPRHIDDAHPLPKRRGSNTTTVILKLANRGLKYEILECQDDLRGAGLYVTEHLTPFTLKLKSAACELVGADSVEVVKTIVQAEVNGRTFRIKRQGDIGKLRAYVESHPTYSSEPDDAAFVDSTENNGSVPVAEQQKRANAHPKSPMYRGARPPPLVGFQPFRYMRDFQANPAHLQQTPFHANYSTRGMPSRNGRGRGFRRKNFT